MLRAAFTHSRILAALQDSVAGSRLATLVHTAVTTLTTAGIATATTGQRLIKASRLYTRTTQATTRLNAVSATSAVSTTALVVERWVRASFLYRWLTAEPDPDVVVIDLRDTLSVGPIIALLDHIIRALVPASHRARVTSAWTTLTHVVRAVPLKVAALLLTITTGVFVALTALRGELTTTTLAVAGGLLTVALLSSRSTHSWRTLRESRPVQLLSAALKPPDPPDTNTTTYAHHADDTDNTSDPEAANNSTDAQDPTSDQ